MAEMMGEPPAEMLLVGVQPEEIEDFGGSLRDSVKAQMEPAIAVALEWLAARGIHATRRAQPLEARTGHRLP
jgi:hydrogenase maturation protease